jgi:hypothetical protein
MMPNARTRPSTPPRQENVLPRIERGENVEGGLGKPMTPEDWVRILRAAGMTASDITPELAKLVPGNLERGSHRLGMERTDWGEHYGKPKAVRTVLIDAESTAGEWTIGANAPSEPKQSYFA